MTTIADLLFDRPAAGAAKLRRRLDEHAAPLGLLAHGVAGLTRQVADAISGFLGLPVGDLIANAWDKQQAVRAACEQTAHTPGGSAAVTVGEHTLTTSQRPRVFLALAGERIPVLNLVLTATLHIDTVTVTVFEGHVTGCGPATASGMVELGIALPTGPTHRLIRRELKRVRLQPYRREVPRESSAGHRPMAVSH